jgi:hypothetical protein
LNQSSLEERRQTPPPLVGYDLNKKDLLNQSSLEERRQTPPTLVGYDLNKKVMKLEASSDFGFPFGGVQMRVSKTSFVGEETFVTANILDVKSGTSMNQATVSIIWKGG